MKISNVAGQVLYSVDMGGTEAQVIALGNGAYEGRFTDANGTRRVEAMTSADVGEFEATVIGL